MHHNFATTDQAMCFYETLLDHLGVDFAIINELREIVCVSQNALHAGTEKDTIPGKNLFEVFPHLVRLGFAAHIDRAFVYNEPYTEYAVQHTTVTGISGYFHRRFIPVMVVGVGRLMVIAIENVDEQHQREVLARGTEMRYQHLIEQMALVSFQLDHMGRFTQINVAAHALFGWQPNEMIGTSFVQFTHPEDVAALWKTLWHVVNNDHPFGTVECRIRTRTEQVKHVRWHIHPLYDHEGKIVGSQGVAEDVTKHQEHIAQLQEQSETYLRVFNSLPVPVAIVSSDDRIVSINRAMSRLLQWSAQDMRERAIFDILLPEKLAAQSTIWQHCKERGGMPRQIFSLKQRDGTRVDVFANGVRFGKNYLFIAEQIERMSHTDVQE